MHQRPRASAWDGESFRIKVQLVNPAESGRRGARVGVRSEDFLHWSNQDVGPVGAGKRSLIIDSDATQRPRSLDLRAKVTKGKQDSPWGKVPRLDRMNIC